MRIGFWNCRGKKDTLHGAATETVRQLLREVDILALCEVQPESLARIAPAGFKHLEVTHREGPHQRWDIGFIWSELCSPRIQAPPRSIMSPYGGRNIRVAVELTVGGVRLLVSHWPSPSGGAVPRSEYVHALAQLVEVRQGTPLVLVGDYNCEPFELDGLRSTRDRALARDRPHLLYNLAWAWTGATPESEVAGSYRYRANPRTNWRSFDQALVSTELLRPGAPQLREAASGLRLPEILTQGFDHLPLVVSVNLSETSKGT